MTDDSLEADFSRAFLAGPDEDSLEDHFTRLLEAAAGAMLLVRARPLSEGTPCRLLVSAKQPVTLRPICIYLSKGVGAGMQSGFCGHVFMLQGAKSISRHAKLRFG